MSTTYAAQMSAPPDDPRLHDQEADSNVDWTIRQHAVCRVDGRVVWEETDIVDVCHTQGDAIWSAFGYAQGWDAKGVGLRAQGRGGSWYGSDGETQVRIHVQKDVRSG